MGILLMEFLWKSTTGIINQRLTSAIRYHNTLHGFWEGRGIGTVNLEAKMLQYIMAIREVVLHDILLDIHKSYSDLYKDMCLNILTGYGVVPRKLRLPWTYWGRLQMVAISGSYYGSPFKG